jgi:hypothetical protein
MASQKSGFGCRITFTTSSTVTFEEIDTSEPGMDGGDPIEIKHNAKTTYVEKYPKALVELTNGSASVTYDPSKVAAIASAINVEQTITHTFKDGSAISYWGFLKSWVPTGKNDDGQPMADIELVPTGLNSGGTEAGLSYATS